jgi:serine/threonine protein kinase
LKLFDFGLAKELDARQKNATGLYEMSGGTGSRRYMAPEVARSEPYHLSADMYSFAIVLWEVLSFEKAYWDMTLDEHKTNVVEGDERPKPLRKWSMSLQALLQGCWHKDATLRPPSKQVQKALQQELESFSNQHHIRLHQRSRRASM